MNIGGIDIILPFTRRVPAVDVVLRRIQRFWPDARFIDADEVESHPIDGPWVMTWGSSSSEFLIYRDAQAMDSWQREGLTTSNSNLMLHFLFDSNKDGSRELTLVCDQRTAEIDRLVNDLRLSFQAGAARPETNRSRAA